MENVRFFSFLAFIPNKALKEVWARSILLTKSLDSFWPLRTHFSFELFPRSNVAEQRGEQETQVNKENIFFKDMFLAVERVVRLLLRKVLFGPWDGSFWRLVYQKILRG